MGRVLGSFFVIGAVIAGIGSHAQEAPQALYDAIAAFSASLDDAGRAKLLHPFNSEERLNWHYFPKVRGGISFKELDADQRGKCLAVLRAALSAAGYEKAEQIRTLESVLRELGGDPATRDPELYYTAVFGEPAPDKPWGLRYEGHHLSLNWTIHDNRIVSSTVQFLGANPGETLEGSHEGLRPLVEEEELGRKLLKSLTDEQRKVAVLSETAPADILTGADREAAIQEDLGLAFKDMTADQQGMFISLITVYASVQLPEVAKARLKEIRDAGLDNVKFAWMGGFERGQGHYYRIQGPTFLIEYDNTQNSANHIHTVWRDFHGDFGLDVLKEHYRQHAGAGQPHDH